jgi:hypothetical protein
MGMLAEAEDIDRDALVAVLRDAWALHVSSIRYEAVGFGSHHYVVDGTWFVTVDQLTAQTWLGANDVPTSLDALKRAFRTTVALHHRTLEFVNAPVETRHGDVVVRLGDRHAVMAYRFVEGSTNPSRRWDGYTRRPSKCRRAATTSSYPTVPTSTVRSTSSTRRGPVARSPSLRDGCCTQTSTPCAGSSTATTTWFAPSRRRARPGSSPTANRTRET